MSSFAMTSDGSLWASGENSSGQLGLGDRTDRTILTRLGGLYGWRVVACEHQNAVGLLASGAAYEWGVVTAPVTLCA